jgi:hypothetical protein
MTDFFDKLYSSIVNKNQFLDKIRFYSILRFIVRKIANIVLPFYFRLTAKNPQYKLETTEKREGRLVVSLTSFPSRINRLWLVIETLLRQTYKPDMVILWLSKEQFPQLETLPTSLLNMQKRGLQIELREGDLRSHKKYYYTLQEYPNDIMITVDDDVFYCSNAIATLIRYHEKYPSSVIANYSHRMKVISDYLISYTKWDMNIATEQILDKNLFFGSGGGTLFPVGSLHPNVINWADCQQVCRSADDVWLNSMARLAGSGVCKTSYYSVLLPVLNKQNRTLCLTNLQGGNDKQMQAVRAYCIKKMGRDPFASIK